MYMKFVGLKLQKLKVESKDSKPMPSSTVAHPVPHDVREELQSMSEEPIMPISPLQDEMPISPLQDEMPISPLQDEMEDLRQSNKNLSLRMGQVETVMSEILDHMRRISMVKTED